MKDLDDYLDAARERLNLPSDRALARKLAVKQSNLSNWRRHVCHPTDDMMLTIAKCAGVDSRKALLDLNAMRAEGTESEATYRSLLDILKNTTTGLGATVVVAGQLALATPAQAQDQAVARIANNMTWEGPELYIMRLWRWLLRLKKRNNITRLFRRIAPATFFGTVPPSPESRPDSRLAAA